MFLAVSAFLTHTLFARLVAVERGEIGLLKAFGYSQTDIAWHYIRFVLVIGTLGVVFGWFVGYWLGRYQTGRMPSSTTSPSCCSTPVHVPLPLEQSRALGPR